MNDVRESFIKNLEDKKRELEGILARMMDSQREHDAQLTSGEYIDDFDDAQREISAHSQYILVERKIKELKKIDLLISRISEEGKFGICEECGKAIPKQRLMIIPEATLCVVCQKDSEKLDLRKTLSPNLPPDMGSGKSLKWMTPNDEDDHERNGKTWSVESITLSEMQETETDEVITVKE
jgi:DnaK suppressor protein